MPNKIPETEAACMKWLEEMRTVGVSIKLTDFATDDEDAIPLTEITVAGKAGCKVRRRNFVDAVGAAWREVQFANASVYHGQTEMELAG
ncbi:MAG: hypothetical protein OES13_00400 [Acidimicrobiia bacterium]|nr:hypothetical protein [Acidimicrobiia bacterium]